MTLLGFFMTVLASAIGFSISGILIPIFMKNYNKRKELEDQYLNYLYRLHFITENYLRSSMGDNFSISGMSLNDTLTETFTILRDIFDSGGLYNRNFDLKTKNLFDSFCEEIKGCLDSSKSSWNDVDTNDHNEIDDHSVSLLANVHSAVGKILKKLEGH